MCFRPKLPVADLAECLLLFKLATPPTCGASRLEQSTSSWRHPCFPRTPWRGACIARAGIVGATREGFRCARGSVRRLPAWLGCVVAQATALAFPGCQRSHPVLGGNLRRAEVSSRWLSWRSHHRAFPPSNVHLCCEPCAILGPCNSHIRFGARLVITLRFLICATGGIGRGPYRGSGNCMHILFVSDIFVHCVVCVRALMLVVVCLQSLVYSWASIGRCEHLENSRAPSKSAWQAVVFEIARAC